MKYLKPIRWQTVNGSQQVQIDDKLRHRLVKNFVKDNRDRFTEITQAISTGDIKLAHRLAHSLKSNAGQLGKTLLQQAAADIEHHLKNNKNMVTEGHLKIFETELNAALMQLTKELSDEPSHHEWHGDSSPLDTQAAMELIEKLEPLLEMGNPECRKFTDILHRLPDSEVLIQQIEDLDFEQAVVSLVGLKRLFKGMQ
jgi:HPt (histidine-containing phosphotransfer) domain-containing protein